MHRIGQLPDCQTVLTDNFFTGAAPTVELFLCLLLEKTFHPFMWCLK